jgi:uncharacterized protein
MKFITVGLIVAALAQAQTPPKPLRERLLERAQKGDAEAQFELGKDYETGRIGLKQNWAEAKHWYEEAANQGDGFAEASLAILYHFGKGVARDPFEAYKLYERACLHLTGADRESVVEMRERVSRDLTAEQIAEAENLAKAWKPVK